MKRSSQLKFDDPRLKQMKFFGGSLLKKSHAKTARPLSTKHAMHLVLRSSQARGEQSFRHYSNQKKIEKAFFARAKKYGIKVYQFANVGNHIHALIRVKNRHTWKPFIRALTAEITLIVTGANKLKALKEKFWDQRPFTRIVDWRRGYQVAKDYVILNQMEALGLLPPRKKWIESTA